MVDCLGWAAAEAVVGMKQGYESIALYGDVLVIVIMSSTPNTEMGSKETPEVPKRQNEERENMWIITTTLMESENQLVFPPYFFLFDFICLCGRTLYARKSVPQSPRPASFIYYPGTNPSTLHQRHDIIVLIHGMPKVSSTWRYYASQAARCVVEPGPQMMDLS
jgi:hypothetical protein